MTTSNQNARITGIAALLAAGPALAHAGGAHVHGFIEGIIHPLTGADHALAALAVGLLVGQVSGRARTSAAVAFLGSLALGLVLGASLGVPALELGLAGSVLAGGALVAAGRGASSAVAVGFASVVGLLHGHAHGAELPAAVSTVTYGAGLIGGTALFVAAGAALARLGSSLGARLAGAAVAAAGVALLVA